MANLFLVLISIVSAAQDYSFFVLTDIHYDIAYDPAYNASALCHHVGVVGRNAPISPPFDYKPLGRFGCDSPLALLTSALTKMKAIDPEPAFLLVTGDVMGHYTYTLLQANGEYNVSANEGLIRESFEQVAGEFNTFFPGTQVIFTIGNNDGYGDYQLPTGTLALQLNQLLYDLWLPLNENLPIDFIDSGYYSSDIFQTSHRMLVLDTNYFSVVLTGIDVAASDQLIWLRANLQAAQVAGIRVIIAMHIPPGPGMFEGKSYNWHDTFISYFEKTVLEFQGIIDFVFAAHEHKSGFQLFSFGNKAVINHPSLSPIYKNNPGFRHYKISGDRQDYNDFFLDILSHVPTWSREVTFSELSGLSTFNYKHLYHQLVSSPEKLFQYIVIANGLKRDLDVHVNISYIWSQAVGLRDEDYMRRVALCSYRYMENEMFDMCKIGLLPIE